MTPRARRRASLLAAAVALATSAVPAPAGAEAPRRALAWPPTLYASAELVLFRADASTGPLEVRVQARGLDATVAVPIAGAARVPLPAGARCAQGVDACGITAVAVVGEAPFEAVLQSPATAGAADTLLLTAHGTVRIPPLSAAGTRHVVVAAPCGRARDFPDTASFASVVPVDGPAMVSVQSACAGVVEAQVVPPEVLTVACTRDGEDLSGAFVVSDAPVLVLSGNAVAPVPADVPGLSADLLLDVTPRVEAGATTFVVPPLPRHPAAAGRGDLVRLVAGEAGEVVVRDDRGGTLSRVMQAGETWDLDTSAPVADLALLVTSEASLAAWHLAKSRAARGTGDAAAVALVPRSRFTTSARFFVPDGYAEGADLVVVAEAGGAVSLDGSVIPGFVAAPGGLGMVHAVVAVPLPAPISGDVHALEGDAPFAAWVMGRGGFKAHAMVAAEAWPAAGVVVRRGTAASALVRVAEVTGRSHSDAEPGPRLYWSVEEPSALLRVTRLPAGVFLKW